MEIFEQFTRIIGYSVFLVGLHYVIRGQKVLNLVNDLNKANLYLLVKLVLSLL